MDRAKKQERARLVRMCASNSSLAGALARGECKNSWRDLLEAPAKFEKVTEEDIEEDIMRVAKEYLKKTNRTVGIITRPEKPKKDYLTIQLLEMPRSPEMEGQMGMIARMMKSQDEGVGVRMDDDNIYIDVGRFALDERKAAEEKLEEVEEILGQMSGMLPFDFEPKIVTVKVSKKSSGKKKK